MEFAAIGISIIKFFHGVCGSARQIWLRACGPSKRHEK